ncbi:MAG: hypothetical protein HFJ38_04840 [Bacilli bacterium]|nr:hypothetical protein [Bacilli bacterium]
MKGKKRFKSKLVLILLGVLLSIVVAIILSKVIFNEISNEEEMMNEYYSKKEKYELIQSLPGKVIEEGKGIDIKKIPSDKIYYRIENDDENIIFYYYLKDESTNKYKHDATITLSNEYIIKKKEYGIEMKSLDEHIESYNNGYKLEAVLLSIFIVVAIYSTIFGFKLVISAIITLINKSDAKSSKNEMSLFGRKYLINGWRNSTHLLTAKELHERVMKDSKSDYNWIASASELVRICKKTSFPAYYALDIKIAILNCFANIENRANCGGDRYRDDPADKEAVQYCYNSLYGNDNEKAIIARKRYLIEMIKTASYVNIFDSLYHPGPTYRKLCEDWRKSKFDEYISKEKIDFIQLVETLSNSFAEVVKAAESKGDFKEDEKKNKESWQMLYHEIMKDI